MRRVVIIAATLLGCCSAAAAADLYPSPVAVTATVAVAVPPPESPRITIIEENDAFGYPNPSDRWYTQGFEARFLSSPVATGPLAIGTGADLLLPGTYLDAGSFRTRKFELLFGQQLFTPADLTLNPPDPRDRPYAGWLYGGFGLLQETDHRTLDHFELQVGVVGPAALGQTVQNGFHGFLSGVIPQHTAAGWGSQLSNEPGIVLSYEKKWRFQMPVGGGFAIEGIPEVGGSLGNVYTYGEVGAMLRFGRNLNADYGPARIRPALSGTTWFDSTQLEGPLGWYVFVGAQGRAVARNIMLDGNTFADSLRVDKEPFVADLSGGLSVFWSDLAKLDFVMTWRSKEFVGQSEPARYGGINLSFKLP